MAGQQPLETPVARTENAQTPDTTNTENRDPLRDQVHTALATPEGAQQTTDRTRVTDQAQAPQAGANADDPYTHTNTIKALTKQLDDLYLLNKKPDDMVTLNTATGPKQVKFSEAVREIKTTIKNELDAARTAAQAINQESVKQMINQNIAQKNQLCRELGLDPTKITGQDLQAEYQRAAGNPDRQRKIEQLFTGLQERGAMELLRHAPAYVKLVDAEVTAKGFANPQQGLNEATSKEEMRKAFDLLKSAGIDDPDLKKMRAYSEIENKVGMTYASFLQAKSRDIINLMGLATEAGKTGQKQTATIGGVTKQLTEEELIVEANKLADEILESDAGRTGSTAGRAAGSATLGTGFLVSSAMRPENMTAGTSKELMDILYVAGHARLDMVQHMFKQGKVVEAQNLYNKVRADMPELIYNKDGTYRQDSFKTLDERLVMGVANDGKDYQEAQAAFLEAIDKGRVHADKNNPGKSAEENIVAMKAANQKLRQEIELANKPMLEQKQALQARIEAMEKQANRNEADNIELDRLKSEMRVIDGTIDARMAHLTRRENLTTYMDGAYHDAKEDYGTANKLYKEFRENEKDDKLKKDLDIDGKIGKTEPGFKGWWNRNWGYVAVGAAIVVAAGLTVATLGIGSAAGAGLVLTSLAAVGVGTAGAAATHWGIERTVNKDAGWESAWKGAKIGLMTSSMIVAPWAASTARGAVVATEAAGVTATTVAGTTAVAGEAAALTTAAAGTTATAATAATVTEGAVLTANVANAANAVSTTSKILGMARTVGVGAKDLATNLGITTSSMPVGFTVSGITNAGDYAFGLKDGTDAGIGFVRDGLINSMFVGQALKWGAAKEVMTANTASATLNASRMSAIPRALGMDTAKNIGINTGVGFTTSGLMEAHNYYRGYKDGGEAISDFLVNGGVNTLTLGVLRKYGFADKGVINAASAPATGANLMTRVAAETTRIAPLGVYAGTFQESAGLTWDLAVNKYIRHDILGGSNHLYDPYGSGGQASNLAPMFSDMWSRNFGSGLNLRHPGDRSRFVSNLGLNQADFTTVPFIDQRFVRPQGINTRGLFGVTVDAPKDQNTGR